MHYRLSRDGARDRSDAQHSNVKGRAAVAAAWVAPATGSNDADANEKKNEKEVDVG